MKCTDAKQWMSSIPYLIWSVVIIASVTLVISTVIFICRDFKTDPKQEVVYPQFEELDEYLNDESHLTKREVLKLIIQNQKALNNDHDDIMADARQNTNDAIEKMTAELNFWVAIIAILGVLIPIALTFKSGQENKTLVTDYISQSSKANKEYKQSLNYQVSQWEVKVNENIKEYECLKKDISNLERELKIEMNLNSISSVRHARLLEINSDLRRVYHNFVSDSVVEYISHFEEALRDSKKLRDNELRWKLIKMTLQLYEVIRNLSLSHSGHTRPRYLNRAEDAIRDLLGNLMVSVVNVREVGTRFRDVRAHIMEILQRIEEV